MRRIVVIGAGVVGLACAWRLQKTGAQVTIVDNSTEQDKCSFGNAGGIAVTEVVPASVPGLIWKVPGWLMDPLGPLSIRWSHAFKLLPWLSAFLKAGNPVQIQHIAQALTALNGLVYDDLVPLLADIDLSGDLHRVGAIVVYSSAAALAKDSFEWRLRRELGIEWTELSRRQLGELEPELSPAFQAGVFLPTWSHVASPRRIVQRLRDCLAEHGASIRAGEVVGVERSVQGATSAKLRTGEQLPADAFVVAAGAWSGRLAKLLGDRVLLESERGYNTTVVAPSMKVGHELIFAEGKFVVTPLEEGLRVGGAAEFAGTDSPPRFERSAALLSVARCALPKMPPGGLVWMGNRPTTPDSLPVIGRSAGAANVFYAFGHGHLGLTQAASTARLIEELVTKQKPSIDLTPFSGQRFNPKLTTPFPPRSP